MTSILLSLLAFSLVGDVRRALNSGDFAAAERLVEEQRKSQGGTPEWLEAHSWLARGALNAKNYDAADRYATATRTQALAALKNRKLDDEPRLPIALGAAIEVHGQVLVARGNRLGAVEYLNDELERYRDTSIRTRIQKNINLLSLEGQPAPPLEGAAFKGKPTLLFFWAHWCPDCKSEAPVIAQAKQTFPALNVIGPTQLYGYVERGRDAQPPEERRYIERIRKEFYDTIPAMTAPVSQENFKVYGASTTPTLVLIDKAGIVRLYRPGRLTFDELRPHLEKLLK